MDLAAISKEMAHGAVQLKQATGKKAAPKATKKAVVADQPMKMALLKELDTLIGVPNHTDKQDDYEIEARIGAFRGNKFTSNVNTKDFFRVLDYFLTHTPSIYTYVPQQETINTEQVLDADMPSHPDIVTEATFEVYDGGKFPRRIRESFIDVPYAPRFYTTKRSVGNVDFTDYFTRFSLAKEQYLTIVTPEEPESKRPIPPGMMPQSVRIKNRWSFALADKQQEHPLFPYRVDMTHVTGWYVNAKGEQIPINTHEIELEVIYKPINSAQDELWPGVRFMLELLQNTPFPVTSGTISNVITGFNDLFASDIQSLEKAMKKRNPHWSFNTSWRLFNVVNKPVNLKMNVLEKPQQLAITDKADGERRLMYMRKDGAYLLYPPNDVSRYLRTPEKGQKISKEDEQYYIDPEHAAALSDTVFDGELVLLDDGTRDFLAFDLIVDHGVDVRELEFADRIKRLRSLLAKNPINVTMKDFHFPDDGNFYDNANKILDAIPNKPYGNDGLIFNNMNESYTKAAVYKWKPPQQLTIDFQLFQVGPNTFEIHVKNDMKKKGPNTLLFLGTAKYPVEGIAEVDSPFINGTPLATGQIVEMYWNSEKNSFAPFRIRHDRDQPNNLSTAIDVWKDIMDPIPDTTIRGHDLKAMRYYHNIIKRNMLHQYCEHDTIVDIGAGRGGDLHKWKQLGSDTEVLAVEPNPDNLAEFHKRLQESGYEFNEGIYTFKNGNIKVAPIEGFGQETDKIVQAYKDFYAEKRETNSVGCVSIFNVLTFFFDKEASLDSLVDTLGQLLRNGGHFIGMVMDGKQVRQLLVKNALLKETISKLGPDQYWNLDTKSRINKKTISKFEMNKKWRLVSKNKKLLKKTVKELEEKDPKEISDHGWTISRTKPFNNTPYGNEIKIHLGGDTIVHDQIEYLVDFEELVRKLKEKNILLKDDFVLSNNSLSPSQQTLNSLYRVFSFERKTPIVVKDSEPIAFVPLTGPLEVKIRNLTRSISLLKSLIEKVNKELADKTEKPGYTLFRSKHRQQIKADNPLFTTGDVEKEIEKMWGELTKKERSKWQATAVKATKTRLKEHTQRLEQQTQELEDVQKELDAIKATVPTMLSPKPVKVTKPVPALSLLTPSAAKPGAHKPPGAAKKPGTAKPPGAAKPGAHKPPGVAKKPGAHKPPGAAKSKKQPTPIESEQIITSVEYNPEDKFAAVEHSGIKKLAPEEKQDVNIKNVDFVRVGNVEGGSCVLSAMLRAAYPAYIFNQNEADAPDLTAQQLAKRISSTGRVFNSFLNNTFKNAFEDGELGLVSSYYEDWDSAKKVLKKCQNWQWLGLWEKIASVFKINIVVVTESAFTAPTIYKTGNVHPRTAVIYSHDGSFDTLGQRDADGNLVTVFKKEDITINQL